MELTGNENGGEDGSGDPGATTITQNLDFEEQMKNMIVIRKRALENIKIAQGRQKKNYDAKHSNDREKYRVGALVLVRNSKKLSRKGSKMEQNWSGPYHINEIVGKGTYRLRNREDNGVLRTLFNIARLKLYHEDHKVFFILK